MTCSLHKRIYHTDSFALRLYDRMKFKVINYKSSLNRIGSFEKSRKCRITQQHIVRGTRRFIPIIGTLSKKHPVYNGCSVPWGDIMSTVGDILGAVGDVQSSDRVNREALRKNFIAVYSERKI